MVKVVATFGSFDIIHPGHLLYLKEARQLGDKLVVVIARDESVLQLKGREPIMDQEARREVVEAIKYVDKAVVGNRIAKPEDRYNILLEIKPDIIAFGYDQKVDEKDVEDWLAEHGVKTKVVRIKKHSDPEIFKSSKIKKKLAEFYS